MRTIVFLNKYRVPYNMTYMFEGSYLSKIYKKVFSIKEATSVTDLGKGSPDVIVIGKETGFTKEGPIIEYIRSQYSNTKIIVSVGDLDAHTVAECGKLGVPVIVRPSSYSGVSTMERSRFLDKWEACGMENMEKLSFTEKRVLREALRGMAAFNDMQQFIGEVVFLTLRETLV